MRKENFHIAFIWFVFLVLCGCSTWTLKNNTYMSYQDTPVEYIKGYITQRCHKSHCHDVHEGLFKRLSDGYVFDRAITANMYFNYPVGSRYETNIRPFDIKQNPRDNWLWFFGAPMLYLITAFLGCCAFLANMYKAEERKK